MNNLKKISRQAMLILLVTLATIGIGINGAAPVITTNKREDRQETRIELVEVKDKKEKSDTEEGKVKK
jgi:hypothetical protein